MLFTLCHVSQLLSHPAGTLLPARIISVGPTVTAVFIQPGPLRHFAFQGAFMSRGRVFVFVQERLCCVCLFCVYPPSLCLAGVKVRIPPRPSLSRLSLSILLDYSCASLLFRFPLTPRGAALSFMKWGSGRCGGGERCVRCSTCFKL